MSRWPEGGLGEMYRLVQSLPQQIRDSASLAGLDSVRPPASGPPRRLVLCGMGGSAIAGDLLRPLLAASATALTIWRDYDLPTWVGPDELVICSSYSGDTEETLDAVRVAGERGCVRVALTSGGALARIAAADGFPAVQLPPGLPPRASLGLGLGALLRVLGRLGVVADVVDHLAAAQDALQECDAARRHPTAAGDESEPADPDGNPGCGRLAEDLQGRIPVLYTADGESHAVGRRWKAQLNENSKLPTLVASFPELDHNDLVGWCLPADLRDRFVLIILRARDDGPRSALRVSATRELLAGEFAAIHEIRAHQENALARIVSLVQYGDYLSCHLARLADVDPVPVERIRRLKEKLAAAGPAATSA